MIDADLADLYGVPKKRLNEQVKRNIKRFPKDFMFKLSRAEKQEVVAKCDHLSSIRMRLSHNLRIVSQSLSKTDNINQNHPSAGSV